MPGISFRGKSTVETLHLAVPYRQLIPEGSQSIADTPTLSGNLIIHGDNLLALKALLPSFSGRVKCIYIDPPYNTGNESWVYNDNVNSPIHQDWLNKVVDREDLTRHDKWLCMMLPRLRILHELLREDGAIFISIDDNEQHRLRMLMDEIFGEQNFVATIVWQKKYSAANDNSGIAAMHDFILIYQKSAEWERILLPRTDENNKQYRYKDKEGTFRASDYTCNKTADERPNLYYPITNPNTGIEVMPNRNRVWAYSLERHQENEKNKLVWWGEDGTARVPSYKRYKHKLRGGGGTVPSTWWTRELAGDTDEAKKELNSIFLEGTPLQTPKPTALIQRILQIATDHEAGDIVLDSFAGSGTTGHAVLAQNAEDGGNRRFILVEQEAYAETLTAERIRRVIAGVPSAKDEALQRGYGGSFTMLRLGPGLDHEQILRGESLPSYGELARYVFFTLTGEQIDDTQIDETRSYLGQSSRYEVYLIYQPDIAFLMRTALTYKWAKALGQPGTKARLVVASHKLVESELLREWRIEFCQLPFEIYRFRA